MQKKVNYKEYFEKLKKSEEEYENPPKIGIFSNLNDFIHVFERSLTEGNKNNFLIIEEDNQDNVYLQYIIGPDYFEIYMEAVSNEYIDEKRKLTHEKIKRLEDLGFELDRSSQNYCLIFNITEDIKKRIKDLCIFSLKIFKDVYNSAEDVKFKFNLKLYG